MQEAISIPLPQEMDVDASPCHFERLPIELRLQIVSYVSLEPGEDLSVANS